VAVDVSIAVAFFVVAWPVEAALVVWTGMDSSLGPAAVGIVGASVAAIFAAALAFRRGSPALALGIAWAGALLQVALGRPPSFSDLAIFAVLFAAGAYGGRVVYWAGLGSALVGAAVITIYLTAGPLVGGAGLSWSSIPLALAMLAAAAFALGLAWTAGALARTARRARITRLAQERAEVEAIVEAERVRIARDMHDVVAHSLAVVIAQADGARYAAASDPAIATAALGTISTTARAALADVRLLLTQLRHSEGDGPQPTLADLEGLYAQVRAAGVDLRVEMDPAPRAEPQAAVQLAVYRILQEALTNALRHGDGGAVSVRLAWLTPEQGRGRAEVSVEVRNRLRAGDEPRTTGHGLIGMGERASLVGGMLSAAPRDGEFVVWAQLPYGEVT
jgi:signal transduction histidine kinase